jgi:hypothetical protein
MMQKDVSMESFEGIELALKEGCTFVMSGDERNIEITLYDENGYDVILIEMETSAEVLAKASKQYREEGKSEYFLTQYFGDSCNDEIDYILRRRYTIKASIGNNAFCIRLYYEERLVKEIKASTFYDAYKILKDYACDEKKLIENDSL